MSDSLPASWPHAPARHFEAAGAYMITGATYLKQPLFRDARRLKVLHDCVLALADGYRWRLQAWAVFPNHYHFVAFSRPESEKLSRLVSHLHTSTARAVNVLDECPGRRVWYQYWDTRLTIQTSYFARLGYVHRNAVHHGMVSAPEEYPWCSARWLMQSGETGFCRRILGMGTEGVEVADDY